MLNEKTNFNGSKGKKLEENQVASNNFSPQESSQTSSPKSTILKTLIFIVTFFIMGAFTFGFGMYLRYKTEQTNLTKLNLGAKPDQPFAEKKDASVNKKEATATTTLKENQAVKEKQIFNFSLAHPVFAQYMEVKSTATPILKNEKIKTNELSNINDFEIKFTAAQKQALEEVGFFLTSNNYIKDQKEFGCTDDFTDTYAHFTGNINKYFREPRNALFITSDVALHLYHILIDRSFQKIEEEKFQPMLRKMTEKLFIDSMNNYNQATDPVIKNSYQHLAVYYLVPLKILDSAAADTELNPSDFKTFAEYIEAQNEQKKKLSQAKLDLTLKEKKYYGFNLDDEIYDLAQKELNLISEAKTIGPSPLFTPQRPYFKNDYSQFKPRSHYTKNNILKSYFLAMMWYGRMGFSLDSPELTREALIITDQLNGLKVENRPISQMWSDMESAIEFFVGQTDDLTFYQYSDLAKKIYGDNINVQQLSQEKLLQDFINSAIKELPKPKIVSEAVALYDDGGERDKLLQKLMQFRFLGQKFTPDAYILNKLTQGVGTPDPETGQSLPSMTTALMPIYVIKPDNQVVKNYIDKWVEKNAPDSDRVIAKYLDILKEEFASQPEEVWTQNIYWNWLNSFRALLSGYTDGYPYFMQTKAWQKKNLGTVLGSYTELKHDTLLYAKQSYAELGGGYNQPDKIPPVPKGYVEPDLTFWTRLIALAEMTAKGLEARNLMPEYYGERYKDFIKACRFFKQIAEQELQNKKISDDDFEKLRVISATFKAIVSPLPGQELTEKEKRSGIIADIHTDAVNGQILYEATGKPYIIYVAVKDVNGARLTRGVVFNHYEFTNPIDGRLSDEDWQKKVYEDKGQLPPADEWSQDLVR
jgi:hypothetical protein